MALSFSWSKQDQPHPQPQQVSVVDQLSRLGAAWDPSSSQCVLQHYFYNQVPAEHVARYQMPPGQDPKAWDKAVAERPNVNSVPVLAVGFEDLKKRFEQQQRQINAYRQCMHELNAKLAELASRNDLHSEVRLAELRARHRRLARRALSLAVRQHVFSQRGRVLSAGEEQLVQRLMELNKQSQDPSVFGSLNEVRARLKVLGHPQVSQAPVQDSLEWARDTEAIAKITAVLAAQHKGIEFLSELLHEDLSAIRELSKTVKAG